MKYKKWKSNRKHIDHGSTITIYKLLIIIINVVLIFIIIDTIGILNIIVNYILSHRNRKLCIYFKNSSRFNATFLYISHIFNLKTNMFERNMFVCMKSPVL